MKTIAAVLLVLGVVALPVRANDDKSGKHEGMGMMTPDACKQDADQFCKDMKPGDGKFGPCMKENKEKFSDGCKQAMQAHQQGKEKMHAALEKIAAACAQDVDKFCKGDKPGDGKFMPCLHEHKQELSAGCKDTMTASMEKAHGKMIEAKKELETACASDTEKFCKGMTPGDGKWGPCLKEHKDALSGTCADAWKKMMSAHEHMGGKGKSGGGEAPAPKDQTSKP